MTLVHDTRTVLVAAVLCLALGMSLWLALDGAVLPSIAVPGRDADASLGAAAVDADALPAYLADLPACEAGSTRPPCPDALTTAYPVIGRVSPLVGAVDGWLATGAVDRFDLTDVGPTLSLHLEGDLGPVIAIHAAGRTLLSADADRRQVEELRLPEGVGLVQVVVHNPTAASRDYRLVLD